MKQIFHKKIIITCLQPVNATLNKSKISYITSSAHSQNNLFLNKTLAFFTSVKSKRHRTKQFSIKNFILKLTYRLNHNLFRKNRQKKRRIYCAHIFF